ncbi:phage tail protein [Methylobacterium sp. WCS2018Hpa-22]|uniref:phage tail protein n=1 Tax=Methylobacterium sp. WCS2018Hpa-22 TaxID=3073633 RepID=UPI0028890DFD|nr:phage tail protein [Methylobacterium sp. WCS2018Hpa-22]
MIGNVLMALGAYRFSVANGGFQAFERSTRWRWAEQEVIGAAPALQYIGPGVDQVAISGILHPHYRGGLRQLDAMRAQAGLGVPLVLVDGTGWYYGDWAIEGVTEGKTVFMPDGAPLKIEFRLELKKYA